MEAGGSASKTPAQSVAGTLRQLYPRQQTLHLSEFLSPRTALPNWSKLVLVSVSQVVSESDLIAYPKFEEEGLTTVKTGRSGQLWTVGGSTLSARAEKKLRLLSYGRACERTYMLNGSKGGLGLPEHCVRGDELLLPGGSVFKASTYEHVVPAIESFFQLLLAMDADAEGAVVRAAMDVRSLSGLPANKPEGWKAELDALIAAMTAENPSSELLALQRTAKSQLILLAARSCLSLVYQHLSFAQAVRAVRDLEPEAAALVLQGIPTVRLPFTAPRANKYSSSERGGPLVTVALSSLGDTDPVFLADSRPTAQAIKTLPRDLRVTSGELYKNAGSMKGGGIRWVRADAPTVPARVLKDLLGLMSKGDAGGSRDKKRGRDDSETVSGDKPAEEEVESGEEGALVDDVDV